MPSEDEESDNELTEEHGVFEPCSAMQCSVCNGLVSTDLSDLEHTPVQQHDHKQDDVIIYYECPHCGSWNSEG